MAKNELANNSFDMKKLLAISAVIVVLTFVVFAPVLNSQFTNWDDDRLILNNPIIKDISGDGIKTMFTSFKNMHYKPLTFMSWGIEYALFGLDSKMFHLTNLILHIINTLLVFWLFRLLTGEIVLAAVMGMMFGLHPMHVESVAWATERKDVLYGLFYLGALIAYIKYITKGEDGRYYVAALLLFILSMLSKMMALSLPFVLILIDRWYGRKINTAAFLNKLPFLAIFLIPLFALGGISQIFEYLSPAGDAEMPFSTIQTFLISCYQIFFYTLKGLFPFSLSAIYPYPNGLGGDLPGYFLVLPVLLLVLGILIYARRDKKELVFAVLFILISILPILQFFLPSAHAITADRYVYLPVIGTILLFVWGSRALIAERAPGMKALHPILMMIFIAGYGFTTHQQVKTWKTSETLWTDVIEKYPQVAIAYNSRGNYYFEREKFQLAYNDYQKALAIKPDYVTALINRGNIYNLNGDIDAAQADFQKALEIDPNYVEAYNNRGILFYNQELYEEALAEYDKALEIDPTFYPAYYNRGIVFYNTSYLDKALSDYNMVVRLNPDYNKVYYNRAIVLFYLKKYDMAWRDVETAQAKGEYVSQDLIDELSSVSPR